MGMIELPKKPELTEKELQAQIAQNRREIHTWSLFGALLLMLIWAYWNMLSEAAATWIKGLYSHGYIVPLIALVLLYMRRQPIREISSRERYAGLGVVLLASVIRVLGSSYSVLDMWTFVLALAGILLVSGGWSLLRWAGPVVVFLLFMFPLPWNFERATLLPLQNFATQCSAILLQTLGFEAIQDGNNILMAGTVSELSVVEQCSGLRMCTVLLALVIALVLINERPRWENAVLLVLAIPVALFTNILRITVTAMFYHPEIDAKIVHDWAGFGMIPVALGLFIGLQSIMDHMFVNVDEERMGNDVMENPEVVFWKDHKKIED